jgi:hypothetical protein
MLEIFVPTTIYDKLNEKYKRSYGYSEPPDFAIGNANGHAKLPNVTGRLLGGSTKYSNNSSQIRIEKARNLIRNPLCQNITSCRF